MSHSENPGYIPGDHWVVCDICGLEYRSSKMRKNYDGLIVCPKDFETRHPQEFVRARKDDLRAKGLVRPEPNITYVNVTCSTRFAIAGIAIAGCAKAGKDNSSQVPSGTFTLGL